MRYDQGVPPPPDEPLWDQLRQQQKQANKLARSRLALAAHLIEQTAARWSAGNLEPADLLTRYVELRSNDLPGFEDRWLEAFPRVTHGWLTRAAGVTVLPAADGEWSGPWPVRSSDPIPEPRTPVAYLFLDHEDRVAYVGSTTWFFARMRCHERDGKIPTSWWAVRCASRTDAFQAEQRLIDHHQPYFNQRRAVGLPPPERNPDEQATPPPPPSEDAPVGVGGYWRTRHGRREFVRTHRRGSRSPTPGGYKKHPREITNPEKYSFPKEVG